VGADYDVSGDFDYLPVTIKLEDLQLKALQSRADLRAAQQGVIAAKSQHELAKANGKVDVTGTFNYDHVSETNTASIFGSLQIPIFNRNQGEIARTNYAISQAQELEVRGERSGDERCPECLTRPSATTTRSSRSIALDTLMPRRNRVTSASIPTSAAPQASWIISMPSAVTGRPSLLIASLSPLI